ncbi:hypothetical protein AALB16_13605 [Lachnospiraceae bacterium 62-35]
MAIQALTQEEEIAAMKELEEFDTPTITNVVAAYPANELCLGLYNPQEIDWYTDNRLRCLYPELGPRCGYAVTAVYGMTDPAFTNLEFQDILEGIVEAGGPVILVLKENFSEKMKNRNAMIGGNMMTAFKQLGVIGAISDAPARDADEMRPMKVQCLFHGLTAGHGTMSIQAVNTPVNVCGMEVGPMEIIHMDENGAVKFPRKYLKEVLERAKKMRDYDEAKQQAMRKLTDPAAIAEVMKGLYK